jgi:hypothetical protein
MFAWALANWPEGDYEFVCRAMNGTRLFVDEKLVLDMNWDGEIDISYATVQLRGTPLRLRLENFRLGGETSIHLAVRKLNCKTPVR